MIQKQKYVLNHIFRTILLITTVLLIGILYGNLHNVNADTQLKPTLSFTGVNQANQKTETIATITHESTNKAVILNTLNCQIKCNTTLKNIS
ncbi:hypothetical protein C5L28_002442 [Lentilactobacillus parakefiri]|uniref:Uncharacterized protein n=1 Tax=Lentilactobacillus parakefiri TaxID=152332 RepID=A0A224VLR9_9LACO|nr:hypothetical protein B8W96_06135 [Lentilactobacillus parakefiri]TDG88029.1 hypothetical protein C5L28_002442 [Lentilactobacillus parakefiri]GAW73372.1 hypothetical protein LPKJCM_02516 [Lentilactobacillus parakefiri]